MPTLADMQASIASEIFRDDLGAAIAAEINRAIRYYQRERFHFNETRQIVFSTVAGKEFYDGNTDIRIPNLLSIDYVQSTQAGRPFSMKMAPAEQLDYWTGFPSSGPPTVYSYFEDTLRVHPVPDGAYPMRISALVRIDPPTDPNDPTNPWVSDAEELIRSRAKRNLYLHFLGDQAMAAVMKAAEDEALTSLKRDSGARQDVHSFTPSPV